MTRETETLFYNIRTIVDTAVETEPRCWLVSKINRISPNGIARITLTQDRFDQHKDYIEKDEDGNIIGMWADWKQSDVEPTPAIIDGPDIPIITSQITCSGKQQIRIGGSTKTFTVTYYDENGELIPDHAVGNWTFSIDNIPVDVSLLTLTQDGAKIKVKFLGDDSYIGKILTVTNTTEDTASSIQIEIIAL